jgi:hypothetical protein
LGAFAVVTVVAAVVCVGRAVVVGAGVVVVVGAATVVGSGTSEAGDWTACTQLGLGAPGAEKRRSGEAVPSATTVAMARRVRLLSSASLTVTSISPSVSRL